MAYSGKHIFFDLDRTLWDFDKNSERALRLLFDELNLKNHITSFELFHKVYHNKNKALWHAYSHGKITKESLRYERFRAALKKFQISDEVLIKQFGDGYVELSPKQTALVPFAAEVLQDLKGMGFTLHIITNGFLEVQHVKLTQAQIHHHFEVILCSEEVGVNKPHTQIFKHALARANTSAQASLMIGDDYRADVAGALKAGMQAIWFQEKKNEKSKYDYKINCLSEIPQLAAKLMR
jgi:putative hydrolase of the HAD superfamily